MWGWIAFIAIVVAVNLYNNPWDSEITLFAKAVQRNCEIGQCSSKRIPPVDFKVVLDQQSVVAKQRGQKVRIFSDCVVFDEKNWTCNQFNQFGFVDGDWFGKGGLVNCGDFPSCEIEQTGRLDSWLAGLEE